MSMITLDATCARGHHVKVVCDVRTLRRHLEQGTLRVDCGTCGAGRPPTAEETLTLIQMVIRCEASQRPHA